MKKGLTIIELLVVIGILGILMAVITGTFSGSTESARAAKCMANMRNLAMAIQAVGVNTHYYPYAGSFKQYATSSTRNSSERPQFQARGWIGWSTTGTTGSYISPYDQEEEPRLTSLTNGTIWATLHGSRECYVCPTHVRFAKDRKLGTPLWSYAMNAYFEWASKSSPRTSGHHGRYYQTFNRADKHLLLAELPFAEAKSGSQETFQTAQTSTSASKSNDPVLQYDGCDGGGDEVIGFNHKDGKITMGHVCFADGHVEKLRVPRTFSQAQARELTKWLCRPVDSNGNAFDISFNGTLYQKVTSTAE